MLDTQTLIDTRVKAMQLAIDAWRSGANGGLTITQLAEVIFGFLTK